MMELRLDNVAVTPPAELPSIELVVDRDVEKYNVAVQLRNVKLYADAYQKIKTDVQAGKRRWKVKVKLPTASSSIELQGLLSLHEVVFYEDYVVVSVDIDTAYGFAQAVGGKLVPPDLVRQIQVLVRPQVDKGTLLALALAAFLIVYITYKEVTEMARDIRIALGITGAGAGGPLSGPATAIALLILRTIFIVALVAQLVQLVRTIVKLLGSRKETKAFPLDEAVQRICNDAGYSVNTDQLRGFWVVGDNVNTFTAVEILQIAKQLQNASMLVLGNVVFFVPNGQRTNFFDNKAYAEKYSYPTDAYPRRQLVSFVRDAAEAYSLAAPAAVEIDRDKHAGFSRVDIPLALAVPATTHPEAHIYKTFFDAVRLFSRRIRQVRADYTEPPPLIMVEREGFTPKLVFTQDTADFTIPDQRVVLEYIRDKYTAEADVPKRFSELRMPLSPHEVLSLLYDAKLAGVHSLRWRPFDEVATVTYDQRGLPIRQSVKMV